MQGGYVRLLGLTPYLAKWNAIASQLGMDAHM
jgi:hypothetical protein